MNAPATQFAETVSFHRVRSGDQLYKILREVYGKAKFIEHKNEIVAYVQAHNPEVTDPNRILAGSVLMLPTYDGPEDLVCRAPAPPEALPPEEMTKAARLKTDLQSNDRETDALLSKFGTAVLKQGSGDFIKEVSRITKAARPEIRGIVRDYLGKNAGRLTPGQYDYARARGIVRLRKEMGVLERAFHNGRRANEVLRIDRASVVKVDRHLGALRTMKRAAKLAKFGGHVCTAVKVFEAYDTYGKWSSAEKRQDKVGIVADYLGGIAGGAAAGVAIAALSTPVGWITVAVVVTAGSVAGSATAETLAEGFIARHWKHPWEQWLD